MSTTTPEDDVIKAASNAAVPPRGPRKPKEREYIVFSDEQFVRSGDEEFGLINGWVELGRTTVAGIFDEKMRDEAEAQIVDKLPRDEQGGPFVTIAVEHWQPREYEIEQPPPVRRVKA